MMMIKRMWPKISSHPYSRRNLCWLEIIDKKKINLKFYEKDKRVTTTSKTKKEKINHQLLKI